MRSRPRLLPHYLNPAPGRWLASFPRSDFSQAALNEIGAFITLFSVKRYGAEFLAKANLTQVVVEALESDFEEADDEPMMPREPGRDRETDT